jgi:PAS domain S-box-containing protein
MFADIKDTWQYTFDTLNDFVMIIDKEGKIKWINKAMAAKIRTLRWNTEGLRCYEIFHGSSRPPSYCPYQEVLEKGESQKAEFFADRLNLYVDVIVSPLFNQKRQIIGGIIIARDITECKRMEEEVKSSLRQKDLIMQEIHHRVKNNLQIIYSLLNLQKGYTNNEQVKRLFDECQNRIRAMTLIHEKLYQSEEPTHVNMNDYIQRLSKVLFQFYEIQVDKIAINIVVDEIILGVDCAISCGLILNELITNSLMHAFPENQKGEIAIQFTLNKDEAIELTYSDNGVGIAGDLDFRKLQTLGLHLVTTLVRQLKGAMTVERVGGTKYTITFKHHSHSINRSQD